jgi:tetratricopeptide (TPR) repeat protein
MRNKIIFLIISLLSIVTFSLSAYQLKDLIRIRLNQANNYERQKKFTKAEKIYQSLLSEFPHNYQVTQRLTNFYLSHKEFDKLKVLLESEKDYINPEFISLTKIEMYLKMGKMKEAEKEANSLIRRSGNNYSIYKRIASIYASNSLFSQAIDLYKSARRVSNNPKLYASEMASLYQYQMNFKLAIAEYLNLLDENTYNFVKYRLEKLDVDNKTIVNAIREKIRNSKNKMLKPLLGEFLLRDKEYNEAFKIFNDLGTDALLKFAEICEKQGLLQLSIKSYQAVLNSNTDILLQLSIYNKIGDLYYQLQNYKSAYYYYMQVVQIYNKKPSSSFQKILRNALYNLANLELSMHNNSERARDFILRAKKLAKTSQEEINLSILLADSYLYENRYENAVEIYNNILNQQNIPQNLQSLAKYKLYLVYIYSNQLAKSDSLFQGFLAHNQESIYLNDIVSTNKFIHQSTRTQQNELIAFLKSLVISNISEVEFHYNNLVSLVDTTHLIFIKSKMADFYYDKFQYEKSLKIYLESSENKNLGIYNEYIQKRIGDCYFQLKKYDLAIKNYKSYLIDFPIGAFAPEVRNLLKEIET